MDVADTSAAASVKSAAQELASAWKLLNTPVEIDGSGVAWPTLADVTQDVRNRNYSSIFEECGDVKASSKVLCANGIICTCRIEWFRNTPYTGMFREGCGNHGILRMSSALGDISGSLPAFAGKISQSKVFPCVGLKLFRGNNCPSANLVFGGKKTGQPELDFFAHSVCTNLTEKVPFWLQWVIGLFRLYSNFPTQSGLSDFAQMGEDGVLEDPDQVNFPWCVLLRPVYSSKEASEGSGEESTGSHGLPPYMHQLMSIPSGSVLYDIYTVPDPAAALRLSAPDASSSVPPTSNLQRVGRVVSTSSCVWSAYDKDLFFKHQKKEDDYAIRPLWVDMLSDDHRNIGSATIDKCVDAGMFENFEKTHNDGR